MLVQSCQLHCTAFCTFKRQSQFGSEAFILQAVNKDMNIVRTGYEADLLRIFKDPRLLPGSLKIRYKCSLSADLFKTGRGFFVDLREFSGFKLRQDAKCSGSCVSLILS